MDNHPPQTYDNAYTDELDDSYGVWKNDGDLKISQRIIRLCTLVHQEILTPEMWDFEHHGTTYETMQESLRTVHNQVLPAGVHLMRRTHRCSTTMDPQIINPQVEPFPSGDILKPKEYEAAFGRNPWVTHFSSPYSYGRPNWMFNPWVPYITYLRKARMEIKFILQSIAQYLLKSPTARGTLESFSLPADTQHYFYFHCYIFRFLDPDVVLLFQGFQADCQHFKVLDSQVENPASGTSPKNVLLYDEEDEFLYQTSHLLTAMGQGCFANALRHLRQCMFYRQGLVRSLLVYKMLEPNLYFDGNGVCRPVVWRKEDWGHGIHN